MIAGLGLVACVAPLQPSPPVDPSPLAVGETRPVELRMLRLEVEGYEQSVGIEVLERLPREALEEVWLLDLPLHGLVVNSLGALADLPVDQAQELSVAAQNMRALMRMTPDNAELEGTRLEELLSLSAALGIPPARPLSELLQVETTERILPLDAAADALVEGLVGSHPASRTRLGPVDAAHPDGIYPVAPDSMPITLYDVVTRFEGLVDRFGPAETEWGTHPGFIEEAHGFTIIEDRFSMIVKVDANALPYDAADLTSATNASVNSTGSQIAGLFDVDDPEWLRIEGLVPEPRIAELTVSILESDAFHPAGDSRDPGPRGNGSAWDLPPWDIERMVSSLAFEASRTLEPVELQYALATGTEVFEAVLDASGWLVFTTFADLGAPPEPAYLWDLESELAQVRLHDGGLAEGDADVAFTLRDVAVGIDSATTLSEIRKNMAANPVALRELAQAITENSYGAADFYYYRPEPGDEEPSDWLFFLAPGDLPRRADGLGRPYAYAHPGFFADPELAERVSDTTDVDGDTSHEKVPVESGDVLYVEDDAGAVYRLAIGDKPSLHHVAMDVTRVR